MARVGGETGALAALGRRLTALSRRLAARLAPRRIARREARRLDEVLRLLERDARLNADLLDELREATRLGEVAPVDGSSHVDLAALVRSATESLAVVASERGITLDIRCGATSIVISADAGDLTHVVGRLLASAVASSVRDSTIHGELSVNAHWTRLVVHVTVGDPALDAVPRTLDSSTRHPAGPDADAWERLGLTTVLTLVARYGGIVRVDRDARSLTYTLSIPGDRQGPAPQSGPRAR